MKNTFWLLEISFRLGLMKRNTLYYAMEYTNYQNLSLMEESPLINRLSR